MISFERFNLIGKGLGNSLFQYAFLRTTAGRLGTQFYCPEWIGDHVFTLNDERSRAARPEGVNKKYNAPRANCGFNASDLSIADGTDIRGFFQTNRYLDDETVKRWYAFKDEKIRPVKDKYRNIDLSEAVGLHLRFGDKKFLPQYVIHPKSYYMKALQRIEHKKHIMVFSDEPERAKRHLKGLRGNLVFIEGNKAYEDLYLMTRCRDFVCSHSTISWWGAWLNVHPDKRIVAPREWLRPGYRVKNNDLLCDGWTGLRTCSPFFDHYRAVLWKKIIGRFGRKIWTGLAGPIKYYYRICFESKARPRLGLITRCLNEPYVNEFVNHYLNEEVDKIYIIDDNSRKDIYNGVCQCPKVKIVTDIPFDNGGELNVLYERIRKNFDWMIIVDMDEYVTTRKHARNTLKKELLTTFKNADCVKIPWVMMAFNGIEKNPDSLLETNVYRWDHDKRHPGPRPIRKFRCRYEKIEVKCVFKTESFDKCYDHGPMKQNLKDFKIVDGVYNLQAPSSSLDLPPNPYYRNLREKDILRAFLLCFHYRVASKQQCIDKTRENHFRNYEGIEAEDFLASDFPEKLDETLRLKSRQRPKMLIAQ